jgi:hypothetical protein
MDYEKIKNFRRNFLYRYVTPNGDKITACVCLSDDMMPIAHIFKGGTYVAWYSGEFLSEEKTMLYDFANSSRPKEISFSSLFDLVTYLFPNSEYYGPGTWDKPAMRFIKSETFIN